MALPAEIGLSTGAVGNKCDRNGCKGSIIPDGQDEAVCMLCARPVYYKEVRQCKVQITTPRLPLHQIA